MPKSEFHISLEHVAQPKAPDVNQGSFIWGIQAC